MSNYLKILPLFTAFIILITACTRIPDGIISRKQMENILYDSYVSEGMINADGQMSPEATSENLKRDNYMKSVLKKYDVTPAQYDSSVNWYMTHLDIYMKVYDRVIKRLRNEQINLQIAKGNHQQDVTIAQGDTVEIWKNKENLILNELPSLSHYFTEIKTTDGFENGDRYRFSADIKVLKKVNGRLPEMVLTVCFTNDSTQTIVRKINSNGHVESEMVTIPDIHADRIIAGFSQNGSGVVMVNNISLLRIHNKIKGAKINASK